MKNPRNFIAVLAVIFVASVSNVGATNTGETIFNSTSLGTLDNLRGSLSHSGINGESYLLFEAIPAPIIAPAPTTFTVYVRQSNRLVKLEDVSTAADGTFSLSLPPGKYVLMEDGLSEDEFGYSINVTVTAKRFSFVGIDLFDDGGGIIIFPV